MDENLMLVLNPADNSILIDGAVLMALGQPQQIQIMINEDRKMLLVKACTVEDREALVVPITESSEYGVGGRSLIKKVRRLTGWYDDCPARVHGVLVPRYMAVAFALSTLERLTASGAWVK